MPLLLASNVSHGAGPALLPDDSGFTFLASAFALPSSLLYRFPGLKRLLSCPSTPAAALPPRPLLIELLSAAAWGSAVAPASSSCLRTPLPASPGSSSESRQPRSAPHRALGDRKSKTRDVTQGQRSKAPTPFFTYGVVLLRSCPFPEGN